MSHKIIFLVFLGIRAWLVEQVFQENNRFMRFETTELSASGSRDFFFINNLRNNIQGLKNAFIMLK